VPSIAGLSQRLNPFFVWRRRHRIRPRATEAAEHVRQTLRGYGVPTNVSDARLRSLRGTHNGKRAFIIGNGPSLKSEDLTRLQGEITFASNKIYLIFDATPWRPTYYSVTDRLVARQNATVIERLELRKLLSDDLKPLLRASGAVWFHERWRNAGIFDNDAPFMAQYGHFSEDALVGIDAGWTVVYAQLQLAFYMGIQRVYLLGMDFDFSVPTKTAKTSDRGYETALLSGGEVNHFHRHYREPGELWSTPRLDCQRRAFLTAQLHYEHAGRKIINVSRQTKLTVFPLATLESELPELFSTP
jgi:hypothetical protein